jgi:hypothetical protein
MPQTLDELMEQASQALARMDYLTCERLCVQALGQARQQKRWAYYARILLPLQEARRQRRQIAAEGTIRLGTASLAGAPADWLDQLTAGCILVTHPHTADDAKALADAVHEKQRFVEVLFADCEITDDPWRVRSFQGPRIEVRRPAPPDAWRDRWIQAEEHAEPAPADQSQTPADWFLDTSEALGDAATEKIEARSDAIPGGEQRVWLLEEALPVTADHEILHQKLGDAARAIH